MGVCKVLWGSHQGFSPKEPGATGPVLCGVPLILYAGSPVSEKNPSEAVRKGVQATLRPWIWPEYGRRNGPKSPFLTARRAMSQARPRLFGQFLSATG